MQVLVHAMLAVHGAALLPTLLHAPPVMRTVRCQPLMQQSLLFADQQAAMKKAAVNEEELLSKHLRPMPMDRKAKAKRGGGGGGFGGGAAPSKKLGAADRATEARASLLDELGVVVVPSVLQPQTAAALRACCVSERELYHAKVEADPELSPTYFNVPVQSHDPRRGYLLLPWREAGRGVDALGEALGEGPILDAMREALGDGAPLGDLFSKTCGGEPAKLWDFFALRTEAGAQRQQIHADTPYQKTPPLFCAFIALQDITLAMGPTCFIPGTHKRTAMRKQFDNGLFDGGRSEMLSAARAEYALLSAGDAAFFDMRTLHAGMENLPAEEGGAPRYYLVLTFLNPNAKKQSVDEIGHRSNMRPGYVGLYTLGDVRRELGSPQPFAWDGDGSLPEGTVDAAVPPRR